MRLRLIAFFLLISFTRLLFAIKDEQRFGQSLPVDKVVTISGKVTNQPYQKSTYQIIEIKPFLIKTDLYPAYFYGQIISATGRLQKRVISRWQTQYVLNFPTIQIKTDDGDSNEKTNLAAILFGLRINLEGLVNRFLPSNSSGLINGVLFGTKANMSPELTKKMQETGVIHVIVASGYNISIVAGFLLMVFVRFFHRRIALIFSLIGIILYTIMAGAQPPLVRAAIMGAIAYLAQFAGRESIAVYCLAFAAFLMQIAYPLIYFDISFQLSFLATAGILLVCPRLKGKIYNLPFIGENLRTTIGAQLLVMPVLIANFNSISLISLIVNALVLPTVPLMMLLGTTMVVFGLLFYPFGVIISWLAWVPTAYFLGIVDLFSKPSWASVRVVSLPWWLTPVYYFIIFLWLRKKSTSSLGD